MFHTLLACTQASAHTHAQTACTRQAHSRSHSRVRALTRQWQATPRPIAASEFQSTLSDYLQHDFRRQGKLSYFSFCRQYWLDFFFFFFFFSSKYRGTKREKKQVINCQSRHYNYLDMEDLNGVNLAGGGGGGGVGGGGREGRERESGPTPSRKSLIARRISSGKPNQPDHVFGPTISREQRGYQIWSWWWPLLCWLHWWHVFRYILHWFSHLKLLRNIAISRRFRLQFLM